MKLPFKDLEDAMQAVAAISFGAQLIATRNLRDYLVSPIKALDPKKACCRFLTKLHVIPVASLSFCH